MKIYSSRLYVRRTLSERYLDHVYVNLRIVVGLFRTWEILEKG